MAEVVLTVVVQVHLQRLELWARCAKTCKEGKVEEGIMIKNQFLDSIDY